MGSQISLRKTGLVVFGARIGSIFTGLAFLVMITRSLSVQQFGLYEVITDLVAFAAYPAGVAVFWATRDIARGKMFGKTAVFLNLALSAVGIALYFAFSVFSASRIPSASLGTLFFAALLVPSSYLNQAANASAAGHKPVVLGYAVIFSEASKLLVAYPLLIVFKVGIDGVILAVMTANLVQSLASIVFARDALSDPISFQQGKKWLVHSWLPMLTTLPLILAVADTYIASLAAGNTTLVGHYQAAFSVATLAGYSLYLASAMYPLLLKGGSDEVMAMTLDLALAFGIPMAVGAAVLATPLLHLLNPKYLDAATALGILAVSALVNAVSGLFDNTLLGKEKVDANEDAKFSDYLKSSIVFVAKVDLALSLTYLAAVYLTIVYGASAGLSIGSTLDVWAVAQLSVFTFFVFVKAARIRKLGKLTIPRSVGYYVLGAGVMAAVVYALEPLIRYGVGTFFLALEVFAVSGTGVVVYGGLVLALDKTLRGFVRKALKESFA